MSECEKCPTSPWAVPRNPVSSTVIKKVCCGRTSTWGEVTGK